MEAETHLWPISDIQLNEREAALLRKDTFAQDRLAFKMRQSPRLCQFAPNPDEVALCTQMTMLLVS